MAAHAILSPSGADIWTECTPQPLFAQMFPNESTPYSEEGTIAHEIAALILSGRAGTFKGSQKHYNALLSKWEATADKFYEDHPDMSGSFADMLFHAENYADYIQDQFPLNDKYELGIEEKRDIEEFAPGCWGTTDARVWTPDVLYVNDYKYGAGKMVSAYRNKQGMIYALGQLIKMQDAGWYPGKVVISIIQPRVYDEPGVFEIDAQDLLDWGYDYLQPRAVLAIKGEGSFKAGSHCQFCPARLACREFMEHMRDVEGIMDERMMGPEDLAHVLAIGSVVAKWVKDVTEDAARRMQSGERIKGFKLVAGQSRRQFISESEVLDVLAGQGIYDDAFQEPKLLSLTEIEARLGKHRFAELLEHNIHRVEGNPKVVGIEEPGRPIEPMGSEEFD